MKRKQYLIWVIGVFGIIGTLYGGYSVIDRASHGKALSIYGLILLILGILALGFFIAWAISVYFFNKKQAREKAALEAVKAEEERAKKEEEAKREPVELPKKEEKVETPKQDHSPRPQRSSYTYESRRSSSSSYSYSTAYVKLVGYGPVLRIEGPRIVDMRNNTYYRIEGNNVMQEGYGLRYEIRGNQIRDAFGGYLYEYSGSNINKVYGGYYASVSGSYITLYDLSQKYEMTDSLSNKQILVAAVLLFGNY